ncbi:hypothetical protein FJ434_03280 [Mesorhizobium sp. B2-5-13]|uniref:hypothetical protein n=1 Tax=unclassified Mesorhizobium TaxID=325217 RepID=UPI00112610EF|nr:MULTISPECIES: hypothetical protein [unclassified Mesorhizobium]TPJ45171.1 hypothetical protein FJ432_02925 [Mesorhizobium sp. B2-6-5]TPJ91458.1 hypothetical protein FJ434_03280 [Mesorhizobium sp. B2-5-13]TPK50001.1 hypothetical protein FJ560_11855 [Mesorhizobium sp. B2-5-5]
MKKSLLSALGLAVALALSMPVPGTAAATKTTAPAATATSTMTKTATAAKPHQNSAVARKACKPTKKHKCPVKHKKHTAKTAASKKAY